MLLIRLMTEQDVPAIMLIQLHCYQPCLHEDQAVVRRRLAQHPKQCWVAEDQAGVCAYLFSYVSSLGSITKLDGDFAHAQEPDCLYLHDLAVAERAAGRGIGPKLVKHALSYAREQQLAHSALVAVQDSAAFWARQGFDQEPELSPAQHHCLNSYPVAARYLVQTLSC